MWGIPSSGHGCEDLPWDLAWSRVWGARPLEAEPEHLNALGECFQEKPVREEAKKKSPVRMSFGESLALA